MTDLLKDGLQPGQKVALYNKEALTGIVVIIDYKNDNLQLTKVRNSDGYRFKRELTLRISDCTYIEMIDLEPEDEQSGELDASLLNSVPSLSEHEDADTASADETATCSSTSKPAVAEKVTDEDVGGIEADIANCVVETDADSATAPDIKFMPLVVGSARQLIEEPMVKLIYGRDKWYSFALQDLRNHWVVSLICADVVIHKTEASVILLATSKYVYVFCLTTTRQTAKPPQELQEFLEALPTPYKISYNIQQAAEYLKRLGINLNGTTDAHQLYSKITGNEQPLTLTEVLEKSFDLGGVLETDHPLESLTAQVTLQLKLFEHMLVQQMVVAFERPQGEFPTEQEDLANPKKKVKQTPCEVQNSEEKQ